MLRTDVLLVSDSAKAAANRVRVLFLCTGNAARSQMAEALARQLGGARVDASSAGSAPRAAVYPETGSVLAELYGIDGSRLAPKPLTAFLGDRFDYVITVCDKAAEACPVFPGSPRQLHWSFPDPAAVEDAAARRQAFADVAAGLKQRIEAWLTSL